MLGQRPSKGQAKQHRRAKKGRETGEKHSCYRREKAEKKIAQSEQLRGEFEPLVKGGKTACKAPAGGKANGKKRTNKRKSEKSGEKNETQKETKGGTKRRKKGARLRRQSILM
ncbi:MAG: hypothetical protein ONB06_10970 [candidate division KSB1 bacterium]|nr:hypothetical protein [candidate division KSB1 bacterium]